MNQSQRNNLIIAGEGGQGVQTITDILCLALFNVGYQISFLPYFGVEQRGSPSLSYIAFGNEKFIHPKFDNADFLIIMQERAIKKIVAYSNLNTTILYDSSRIVNNLLPKLHRRVYGIPATQIADKKFNPLTMNLILLGSIAKLLNIDKEILWKETYQKLKHKFKSKDSQNVSQEALFYGYDYILEEKQYTTPSYRPKNELQIFKNNNKIGKLDLKLCKGCGICLAKCPVAAISWSNEYNIISTKGPKIDLERCIACGNCRNFCPDGAIGVDKLNKE